MARKFAARGYPSLRFDYRGMGDSDGCARSFEDLGEDIAAAALQFREEVRELDQIVAVGLCDAASAILLQIQNLPMVGGMILINPWVRSGTSEAQARIRHYYVRRIFQRGFWAKLAFGKVDIIRSARDAFSSASHLLAASLSGTQFDSGSVSYIDRMRNGLVASDMPVLFLISGRDLTADEFMDLASHDASWKESTECSNIRFERLPGADHTFSSADDLVRACDQCLDWLAVNY